MGAAVQLPPKLGRNDLLLAARSRRARRNGEWRMENGEWRMENGE